MASARVGPAHQSNETLVWREQNGASRCVSECSEPNEAPEGTAAKPRRRASCPSSYPDVTALLIEWTRGDNAAVDKLLPLVHGELRRLAKRQMAGERQGHVLQATALVNEVYLKLIDIRRVQWQDRAHFFAMAARLMRRVLVDFARAGKNQKRGGAIQRITFDQDLPVVSETPEDLIAIDDALAAFGKEYERRGPGRRAAVLRWAERRRDS